MTAVFLLLLAAINFNVYLEFKKSISVLPYIIGGVGVFGLIGALVRLISLSIIFQWWWFLAFTGVGLLLIGVFSFLTQKKLSLILGTINILLIPFVWWYGSRFNTVLSYEWIYDSVDAVHGFFI